MGQNDTTNGLDDQKTTKTVVMYNCSVWEKTRKSLYLSTHLSDVNFLFYEQNNDNTLLNQKVETKADKSSVKARKLIDKIPAHKFVLATTSEVFFKMFYGSIPENGSVEIVNSSPEAFREFLQCFYMGSVHFTKENISEVMNLAKMYDVTDCLNTCVTFLMDTLTPEDICSGYKLAIVYDQRDLQVFCEQQIALNAIKIFGSTDFLTCDRDVLKRILQLELMPCDETIIFDSCLAWAKYACNKMDQDPEVIQNIRDQLEDCLPFIRFGTMKIEELTNRTTVYGDLFKGEEWSDMIHSITVKNFEAKYFSQTKRLWWKTNNIWQCRRSSSSSTNYYMQDSETVHVRTNKTVLLGGIFGATLSHRDGSSFNRNAILSIIEIPGMNQKYLHRFILRKNWVDFIFKKLIK